MTKTLLIALALVGMVSACDASDVSTDATPDVRPDAAADAVVPGPRIAFDQTDFDAGKVAFGVAVTHVYAFHNAGDAPLVVTVPLPPVEALEGC